ncbi:MAG: hypothetical protein CM15mP62_01520 [Rhodospirillaceae bacterium]|nr:MAG: hypothetical protein CM15mP62_01520 [Rhodospirillaceae bacterium]
MKMIKKGPTKNIFKSDQKESEATFSLKDYEIFLICPKSSVGNNEKWGAPIKDPFVKGEHFVLPVCILGNVVLVYNLPEGTTLIRRNIPRPALVPPHGYLAFFMWLKNSFKCEAVIHLASTETWNGYPVNR